MGRLEAEGELITISMLSSLHAQGAIVFSVQAIYVAEPSNVTGKDTIGNSVSRMINCDLVTFLVWVAPSLRKGDEEGREAERNRVPGIMQKYWG